MHIAAVTLYSVSGALQFAPRLRRAYPRWHRRAGRVVVPAGLVAAATGLGMNQVYALPATDGLVLYYTRLTVGVWMTFALCRGYIAVRQREFGGHQD